MLVEPSAMQGKIIERSLREHGVGYVTHLTSGVEALAQLPVVQPDVIVSAMYLPEMTGTDLLYQLRDSDDFRDVLFMLISSETCMEQLEPLRQAGVVALLPKPFSPTNLQQALDNTINLLSPDSDHWDEEELAGIRALLVDDSRLARSYVRKALMNAGLTQFREAENGQEAVKLLEVEHFDLVVADYNMPEMDGYELLQYVRQQYHRRDLPVMMVTSESDSAKLAAFESAGVSALCDKPMEAQVLHQVLSNVVGH